MGNEQTKESNPNKRKLVSKEKKTIKKRKVQHDDNGKEDRKSEGSKGTAGPFPAGPFPAGHFSFPMDRAIHVLTGDEKTWTDCFQIMGLCTRYYPKPHQLEGVRFMLECEERYKGSVLADEMGLGKTLQVNLL